MTSAGKAHAFAIAGVACLEYNRFLETLQAHEGAGSPSAELEQFFERTEERGNKVRAALTPVDRLPGVAAYISDLTTQVDSEMALASELKKSASAYLKLTETKPFAEKTRRDKSSQSSSLFAPERRARGADRPGGRRRFLQWEFRSGEGLPPGH